MYKLINWTKAKGENDQISIRQKTWFLPSQALAVSPEMEDAVLTRAAPVTTNSTRSASYLIPKIGISGLISSPFSPL